MGVPLIFRPKLNHDLALKPMVTLGSTILRTTDIEMGDIMR